MFLLRENVPRLMTCMSRVQVGHISQKPATGYTIYGVTSENEISMASNEIRVGDHSSIEYSTFKSMI